LKVFSKEELALHNGRNSSTIYVAYKGLVYDVTTSELFKGGKHYFHDTGIDLTVEMDAAPHLDDVMKKFPVVGSLGSSFENELISSNNIITKKNETSSEIEFILEGRTKLNHATYHFYFTSTNRDYFTKRNKFGSYVNFLLNINGIEYKRSYSIANIDKNGLVEFLIQEKPGGVVSEHLIHNLKLGDKIYVKGLYGGVDLTQIRNNTIYLVATDVGVAPLYDIVNQMLKIECNSNVKILIGDRYREDVLFDSVFKTLSQFKSNLTYQPYLSRENFVNFKKGYVSDFFKTDIVDNDAFYIIVGWNRMTNDIKDFLSYSGVKKESIYVQMYT
jgi:NAD(P)H-flavin reductase/predicted heme/steroid binding protein